MHKRKSNRQPLGFTIVELLIVIVVIGILAGITIIAFNGVTNKAKIALLQSDLRSGADQIALTNTETGTYPTTLSEVNNGQGLKTSNGVTPIYATYAGSYCLSVTKDGGDPYFISTSSPAPKPGSCEQRVATVAGSGAYGNANGNGTAATFANITGIVMDSKGNLFVSEYDNAQVRKITPNGDVTTFAGSTQGYLDGVGTAARLDSLGGITIDKNDNLYVTDYVNPRIRKITPAAVVTTIAGDGSRGAFKTGNGSAASFTYAGALAIAPSGNLIVPVNQDNRILQVTPGGDVSVIAGGPIPGYANGPVATATLNQPVGVTVDSAGVIYFVENDSNAIRKIANGVVSLLAGSVSTAGSTDGVGTAARFNIPRGLTIGLDGMLYVSEANGNRVRKVALDTGTVTTVIANGAGYLDGPIGVAKLSNPGVIYQAPSSKLYISDNATNHRVRSIALFY